MSNKGKAVMAAVIAASGLSLAAGCIGHPLKVELELEIDTKPLVSEQADEGENSDR